MMLRTVAGLVGTLVCGLALGGCDMMTTEPATARRVVGIIDWQQAVSYDAAAGELETILTAPDTVRAGQPFPVTITTFGRSGCWQADGVIVTGTQASVTVTPFDLVLGDLESTDPRCTGALVTLPRSVYLLFTAPGPATIRVQGRRVIGNDLSAAAPLILEKSIVVL